MNDACPLMAFALTDSPRLSYRLARRSHDLASRSVRRTWLLAERGPLRRDQTTQRRMKPTAPAPRATTAMMARITIRDTTLTPLSNQDLGRAGPSFENSSSRIVT